MSDVTGARQLGGAERRMNDVLLDETVALFTRLRDRLSAGRDNAAATAEGADGFENDGDG
jgi:hypothetical protein